MAFKGRPYFFKVQPPYVFFQKHHAMRVPHGNACHLVRFPIHFQGDVYRPLPVCLHGNLLWGKLRGAHIDFYHRYFSIFHSQIQVFHACQRLHGNGCLIRQPIIIYILCHTTDPIPAHFPAGTVCIVHCHLEIGFLGGLNQYQPIRPYPKMPVADKFRCPFWICNLLL